MDQETNKNIPGGSDMTCFRLDAFKELSRELRGAQLDVMVGSAPAKRKLAESYDYVDEKGELLFQILRYEPKYFWQQSPDGTPAYPDGVRLVLYRLPDVLQAGTVLILEGEKDVETAYKLGIPKGWAATTNPWGSGKWRSEFSEVLRGKRVIICPDQDRSGWRHLRQVTLDLVGKAAAIQILTLPNGAKDLSAWVEARGTAKQFAALLNSAPPIDYVHPLRIPPVKKTEALKPSFRVSTVASMVQRAYGRSLETMVTQPETPIPSDSEEDVTPPVRKVPTGKPVPPVVKKHEAIKPPPVAVKPKPKKPARKKK